MTNSSLQVKMVVDLPCMMAECATIEKRGNTIGDAIELMRFHMFAKHGQGGAS